MDIADLPVPHLGPAVNTTSEGVIHCSEAGCRMPSFTHWSGLIERGGGESCRMPFRCEGGHEFDLVIEQYKGETLLRLLPRPDRIRIDAP